MIDLGAAIRQIAERPRSTSAFDSLQVRTRRIEEDVRAIRERLGERPEDDPEPKPWPKAL